MQVFVGLPMMSTPLPGSKVDDTQNNNYSSVNNNLLDVSTASHPSLRRWQRWGRNLVTFNCLFVPTPRQYVEIPRTPAQTHTHTHSTHTQHYQEPMQSDNLDECSSGGGCTTASPAHSQSTYRPFEQLVLSAWRLEDFSRLRPVSNLHLPIQTHQTPVIGS